jgi:hypothetical protein
VPGKALLRRMKERKGKAWSPRSDSSLYCSSGNNAGGRSEAGRAPLVLDRSVSVRPPSLTKPGQLRLHVAPAAV